MLESTERWLTVAEYENYEVSSWGNVRRKAYTAIQIRQGKEVKVNFPQKTLSLNRKASGYVIVDLVNSKGAKSWYVHRLVGTMFIGRPKDNEINHKDGNKTNNNFQNLEWVTHAENINHRNDVLWNHAGQCLDMLKLYNAGCSYAKLSKMYNNSESNVSYRLSKARNLLKEEVDNLVDEAKDYVDSLTDEEVKNMSDIFQELTNAMETLLQKMEVRDANRT